MKNNKQTLQKISDSLACHDSILKAITGYGRKFILTLEEGNYVYWVRLYDYSRTIYDDIKIDSQYFYLDKKGLDRAITYFNKMQSEYPCLKYNNFDRVDEHIKLNYN